MDVPDFREENMGEKAYTSLPRSAPQLSHEYGTNVHIMSEPYALTQLARLCSPGSVPPEVSVLVRSLYQNLLRQVVNEEFPRCFGTVPSRMEEYVPDAAYHGEVIASQTLVTTVDIARAGILPSQTCFDELSGLMDPACVRQDHLMMSRLTTADQKVTGAGIGGMKLAGPVDGRILLFPDPMGATGSSLSTAIQFYKDKVESVQPAKMITLNLIVTPEFIRRLRTDHPDVILYAYRLDRGASPEHVLQERPGVLWDQESGLTENHYIVPGGGGFGEILNNALE
jgi:uracil phosphoribosyltransferase